jgi:hypothetical protein
MARSKKCPPGVLCIENYTLVFILLLLGIVLYCMYFYNSPTPNHTNVLDQNYISHYHNNLPPHQHHKDVLNLHKMFNVSSLAVNESGYNMLRPLADPRISVSSNPKDTLLNPYAPPLHVNQPHRYKQIGYLKNESMGHQMFPIFAKPQHLRRDKWYYYTIFDNIKLPIYSKGRKCSSEHGCDSLYSGDMVTLENMPGNFVVTTYDNETLTYDPAI